jgi:Mg/Co/Ni transporter MgtE
VYGYAVQLFFIEPAAGFLGAVLYKVIGYVGVAELCKVYNGFVAGGAMPAFFVGRHVLPAVVAGFGDG